MLRSSRMGAGFSEKPGVLPRTAVDQAHAGQMGGKLQPCPANKGSARMIPELGHFALALALALSLAQAATGLIGAPRAEARLMAAAPPLAAGVLVAIGTAFACLM